MRAVNAVAFFRVTGNHRIADHGQLHQGNPVMPDPLFNSGPRRETDPERIAAHWHEAINADEKAAYELGRATRYLACFEARYRDVLDGMVVDDA